MEVMHRQGIEGGEHCFQAISGQLPSGHFDLFNLEGPLTSLFQSSIQVLLLRQGCLNH